MTDMDVADAARQLGVSERTVRRWLRSGRLPGYRVGARIRIPERAIREAVAPYGSTDPGDAPALPMAGDPPTIVAAFLASPERRRARARQAAAEIDRIRREHSRPPASAEETAEALVAADRRERDRHWERRADDRRP